MTRSKQDTNRTSVVLSLGDLRCKMLVKNGMREEVSVVQTGHCRGGTNVILTTRDPGKQDEMKHSKRTMLSNARARNPVQSVIAKGVISAPNAPKKYESTDN